MNLLETIRDRLNIPQPIYISDMPATPDDLVSLYQSGGASNQFFGGLSIDSPTIYIEARSAINALNIINNVVEQLKGVICPIDKRQYIINSAQATTPKNTGKDQNQRSYAAVEIRFICVNS